MDIVDFRISFCEDNRVLLAHFPVFLAALVGKFGGLDEKAFGHVVLLLLRGMDEFDVDVKIEPVYIFSVIVRVIVIQVVRHTFVDCLAARGYGVSM